MGEVWHKVLDHVHVGEGADLGHLARVGDPGGAGQAVQPTCPLKGQCHEIIYIGTPVLLHPYKGSAYRFRPPISVVLCFVHVCFVQVTILDIVWRSRRAEAFRCVHFSSDIYCEIQEGVKSMEKCARHTRASGAPHVVTWTKEAWITHQNTYISNSIILPLETDPTVKLSTLKME